MTGRRAAAVVLAVLLTGLLGGCGSGMNHGTITGKQVNPGYTYYVTTCVAYNSKGYCQVSMPMPHTVPTTFVLDLKDGKQTGTVDVDEAAWDAAAVGQQWPPAAKAGT